MLYNFYYDLAIISQYTYYEKPNEYKNSKFFKNLHYITSYTVDNPYVHVSQYENKDILIVAISGTATLVNALYDIIGFQEQTIYNDNKDILVHSGLFDEYNKIKPLLNKYDLLKLLRTTKKKIILTGHSSGGSLSTFLLLDIINKHNINNIVLCLFAAPRIGNEKFFEYFNNKFPKNTVTIQKLKINNTHLVINEQDVIPQSPPHTIPGFLVGISESIIIISLLSIIYGLIRNIYLIFSKKARCKQKYSRKIYDDIILFVGLSLLFIIISGIVIQIIHKTIVYRHPIVNIFVLQSNKYIDNIENKSYIFYKILLYILSDLLLFVFIITTLKYVFCDGINIYVYIMFVILTVVILYLIIRELLSIFNKHLINTYISLLDKLSSQNPRNDK